MRLLGVVAMTWLAAAAGAQTTINGSRRILGAWDASQATSTKPARQAADDPSNCAEGEIYYNTNRHVHRQCVGPNSWSDLAGGGSGGSAPAGATYAIQYNGGTVLAAVAVNGSATRKFLTQASGSAPILDSLQAADIPTRKVAMYAAMTSAKCQAGVPVANFNLPPANAPAPICQTGTTYGAVLRFAAGTTQSFMEHVQLPGDWAGTPDSIDLELAGRSADSSHSVGITVQYACVGTNTGIDNLTYQSAGTVSFVPNAGRNRTVTTIPNLGVAGCNVNDEYYLTVAISPAAEASAGYELISIRPVVRRML